MARNELAAGPSETAVLAKQREREAAEFQKQREALIKDSNKSHTVGFVGVRESIDDALKQSTVGLVSLSDFQRTRQGLEEDAKRVAARTAAERAAATKKLIKEKKKEKSKLSFAGDEPEDDDAPPVKRAKTLKNPAVDTSFLPDREREEAEREAREQLRQAWLDEQERIKAEAIEVTYSYWDGSGHRKVVECKKGDDIATFLLKCRNQIPELRGTSIENLMYIKEDLIIPHHYTFYDFIINKARGKSGPLFNFDVHDDVRLFSDATKEKDESHAGKVVERSWYNRYKHIFPASRWEVYDPNKEYGSYRIA
ncbi:hypothetical protein Q5752_000782 [Cryptotrichosporon argae]